MSRQKLGKTEIEDSAGNTKIYNVLEIENADESAAINFIGADTSNDPLDGAGVAVPANCETFLVIYINGNRRLIPLFEESPA